MLLKIKRSQRISVVYAQIWKEIAEPLTVFLNLHFKVAFESSNLFAWSTDLQTAPCVLGNLGICTLHIETVQNPWTGFCIALNGNFKEKSCKTSCDVQCFYLINYLYLQSSIVLENACGASCRKAYTKIDLHHSRSVQWALRCISIVLPNAASSVRRIDILNSQTIGW